MMIGRKPNIYFRVTWLFLTPALIIVRINGNELFCLISWNHPVKSVEILFVCLLQGIVAFRAVEYETLMLFNDTYTFPGWAEGLGQFSWFFNTLFIAPPLKSIGAFFHPVKDFFMPLADYWQLIGNLTMHWNNLILRCSVQVGWWWLALLYGYRLVGLYSGSDLEDGRYIWETM